MPPPRRKPVGKTSPAYVVAVAVCVLVGLSFLWSWLSERQTEPRFAGKTRPQKPEPRSTKRLSTGSTKALQNVLDRPDLPKGKKIVHGYRILNTYKHDRQAFTQGLLWDEGHLLESTGLYGRSSLRRVELETGKVIDQVMTDSSIFGEGLTVVNDSLIMLTWHERKILVYDRRTFELLDQFKMDDRIQEGWGLAFDGKQLLLTDSTTRLFYLNPRTFDVVKISEVKDSSDGKPVQNLNELEFINGRLFANLWYNEHVAIIDIDTATVQHWIDFRGLPVKPTTDGADCLNGIAYDEATDRLFITGKLYKELYEVQIIAAT